MILDECVAFSSLLQKVYKDFGFTEIIYKVATRPEQRIGSDESWDKAEAADLTDAQRFHVETARLSFQYYKANLFRGEFGILNPLRGKRNEALYDDLKAHGITMICAYSPIPAKEDINFFFTSPVDWR